MDDLDVILTEIFRKYVHVVWEILAELAHKTWLSAWGALHDAAVWLETAATALSSRVAVWQVCLAVGVVLAGGVLFVFRETFFVRRVRHNVHWLRLRGYRPMLVAYRLGGKAGRADFLGRETAVPERFPGLRLFEAVPEAYVVVFGAENGGPARMVRTYPRRTRAGRAAMVRDLAAYVREMGRYVNPHSEQEALLAFLADMDPAMAEFRKSGGNAADAAVSDRPAGEGSPAGRERDGVTAWRSPG